MAMQISAGRAHHLSIHVAFTATDADLYYPPGKRQARDTLVVGVARYF